MWDCDSGEDEACFRAVTPCRLADTDVSEKHTTSIFRVEDGSVPNETKVVGKRSDQFRV
jgi:hypothetical protein